MLLAALALMPLPAGALDLFARHEVSVQFATPDGKPMADAEVRVFAPGTSNKPALTGRTDANGRFDFPADTDGLWTAEARSAKEIARATIRVGVPPQGREAPLSPYWVFGGLFLLLVLAFTFRVLRARARRPPR